MTTWDNPLRRLADGGPGFCYSADPQLFAGVGAESDGPLLIGLDSNVMFDIEKYGGRMIDGDDFEGVAELFQIELLAEQRLLELWMIRDIRFVVLPGIRADFKRPPSEQRLHERERWFSAVEEATYFQLADWDGATHEVNRGNHEPFVGGRELATVPGDLDRTMLESAWRRGVDVFLTRDQQVVDRAPASLGWPRAWTPSTLARHLDGIELDDPFNGGFVDHPGWIWQHGCSMGDMGKWVPLLEAFGSES